MAKKSDIDPILEKAVADLLKTGTSSKVFEEKKAAIEIAMKFEALKLKAKGPDWGKGFESEPGGDDNADDTF